MPERDKPNCLVPEPEQWPFHPRYLTEKVPEELITLIITGISVRLAAPVVLFQLSMKDDLNPGEFLCPIYPIDRTRKLYNYPEFCKFFNTEVPGGDMLCFEDGCKRTLEILGQSSGEVIDKRCYLQLTNCMAWIKVLGHPLAVCTSGKFINAGDEDLVQKKLTDLERTGKLTSDQKKQLEQYAQKEDCRRDLEEFKKKFEKEIWHFNNMVEHYLLEDRRNKEQACREEVSQLLYRTADVPERLREGLEGALEYLRKFLSVRYLALFLSLSEWDRVLPLVAQTGLPWDQVNSCHFNWRKAGLGSIRHEGFSPLDWLNTAHRNPEFPEEFIKKGVKGPGSGSFRPAIFLLPVGRQYRGVLLVGEWVGHKNYPAPSLASPLGVQDFLKSIGQRLVTHAISKRALYASLQHDRRRDLIVALTAHSIRTDLHRFWNSLQRTRRYLKKPNYYEEIINITEGMEQIIRAMKRNVELAMAAPGTAVYPLLHPSEMELEDINLAALIHNIVDNAPPQATSKQLTFVISEDINDLPLITGDRYMLELVFLNIIENAIKYSSQGKEIRIYPQVKSLSVKNIHITISDYGWGIPEEEIEKIFEPRYKSDQVHKLQPRGIGLGLYQAREFIKLHGGKIWAMSRPGYPGAGLSSHVVYFYIELPVK